MYNWQTRFNERRAQFIARSLERLGGMDILIHNMEMRPGDLSMLKQIAQHFHQLNGAAGIYEMTDICKMAGFGEDQVTQLIQHNIDVGREEIQMLNEILQNLRRSLLGEQGEVAEPQTFQFDIQPGKGLADVVIAITDQSSLYALTRMLEEKNLSVRSCRSAATTIDAVKQRMPDALIMNIPQPDGNGYDVARQLRQLPEGHKPAIIMLSQESKFSDKVMALRSGADAIFEQPIDLQKVITKLMLYLERDKPQALRILSVEDDPDQAVFVRSVLESAGYNVATLSNPRNFEETLIQYDPHLLLLDIMLGDMNGFELAKFVRQHERFATVPIIFLTTQNQLNFHIQSARVGGDDHLVKPVAPPLLVAAVAGRLERYRMLQKIIGRDALTGLMTHGTFMEQSAKLVSSYDRKYTVNLIVFDIDNLNVINERFGYANGDKVILAMANLLKESFRQTERLGRVGGNEVAVIVEDLEEYELESLIEHVLKDFEAKRHTAEGMPFSATASAGLAALQPGMDLKTWMNAAEKALKVAKEKGKNRVISAHAASAWETRRTLQ